MSFLNMLKNESFGIAIIGFWILTNLILFSSTYAYYNNDLTYTFLRHLIGAGLPLARASAICINLNAMLVILPVCRNFLLLLSNVMQCSYKISYQLWKNHHYHQKFAKAIFFFSIIHIYAHCSNYELLYSSYFSNDPLTSILANVPSNVNNSNLNPITSTDYGVIIQTLKTVPGITGLLMFMILVVMITTSGSTLRHLYYEIFWFSHHLFGLFFILMLIHGIQGIIKQQVNLTENNPLTCANIPEEWELTNTCKMPHFSGHYPQTWKWIILPITLYIIDRCIRFCRNWETVTVVKIIQHPASVLELRLLKSNFSFNTGQYIYLHCPIISKHEWHPFTLTSSPSEPYFSIHIRQAGDWTEKLINRFTVSGTNSFPRVAVDGPYGSPSEQIFFYRKVILIGAGIGVTPFVSVLKSLLTRKKNNHIENIQFFWLCSKPQAFEWFANFLRQLETTLHMAGKGQMVEYHIYLTRGWNMDKVWEIFAHEHDQVDIITGFRQKTNFGRPNWDQIFSKLATTFDGRKIGLFYCGPKELASLLSQKCKTYSKPGEDNTRFYFHTENF